ncbi:hypothetical protein DSO57_1025065 [Entomophthora muscae]|uniref:Uncharacterized protein n=1 Tax=Entomophthora muscae TaxID=34485 RepID=A0ACC2SF57_9FUNG|nr:hypothetical protein DSO57_1025065 [Entomophthora muscae]
MEPAKVYSQPRLWGILALIGVAGMIAPISSAIYFPALPDIQKSLATTEQLLNITVAGFMAGMGIFPLIWGTLADAYGRRGVYLTSILVFVVTSAGCGLSQDVGFLIAMRIMQGASSSAALVTGAGTISDVFPPEQRGTALSTFSLGPLIGPVVGPLIGGYLNQYLGWRWIFLFLTVFGALILVCLYFFLPETLPQSRRQAYPFSLSLHPFSLAKTGKFLNPFQPLKYVKYPKVMIVSSYVGVLFASYYFVTSSKTRVLKAIYSLTSSQIGLCYIPQGLGNILGSIIGGRVSDAVVSHYKQKSPSPRPEVRLYSVALYIPGLLLGLSGLGFSLQLRWPLASTLAFEFLVGFGMTGTMSGTSPYLIDLFPESASSIVACDTCIRSLFAVATTSVGSHILDNLTYVWAYSIFALLQIPGILILGFFVFFYNQSTTTEPSIPC